MFGAWERTLVGTKRTIIPPLRWAKAVSPPEWLQQRRKPTPRQSDGLRYENAFVGYALQRWPSAIHGQWWEFEDVKGRGWVQTDLWIPEEAIIIECKLTWSQSGMRQLEDLYVPIIAQAACIPLPILVCKNLRRSTPRSRICANWPQVEAFVNAGGGTPIFHWMGGTIM